MVYEEQNIEAGGKMPIIKFVACQLVWQNIQILAHQFSLKIKTFKI